MESRSLSLGKQRLFSRAIFGLLVVFFFFNTTKHRLKCLSLSKVLGLKVNARRDQAGIKGECLFVIKIRSSLLKLGDNSYLLFLSLGFLFMLIVVSSLPCRTMWGYTLCMCRGFPCWDNDVKGARGRHDGNVRVSAQLLCSVWSQNLASLLHLTSLTLSNSKVCILFLHFKVPYGTHFQIFTFHPRRRWSSLVLLIIPKIPRKQHV